MEVITKVLDELIDIPPNHFVFDIETTGLNSNYCKVILIGILFNQDNKIVIKQYFANTEDDEKELLLSFINDIKNYKNHITFNGLTFDIPFLNTRLKKHNIDFSLSKNDCFISSSIYSFSIKASAMYSIIFSFVSKIKFVKNKSLSNKY